MKRLFTLLLLLMCSYGLFAQLEVTIGTGTITNSNTSYPAPYGNYYNAARHQLLIPASEIIASGGYAGNITALSFSVNTANAVGLVGFQVSIGATTATALGTWQTPVMTQVYSAASYTEVAGWNTHTFSTPYNWDGVSNLIIETCFNNIGVTTYTNNAVMNQSITSYVSSMWYNNDTDPLVCTTSGSNTASQRPNIKLTFAPNIQLDAGIMAINSPVAPVVPGVHAVTATLKNYGITTLTSATVNWSVNGVLQTPYAWTGSLASTMNSAPFAIGSFNFPSGNNTIKVWSSAPNAGVDGFAANDTTEVTLLFYAPLNGNYTIGGVGANYPTLTHAFTDLYSAGASGPVTFNVNPNTGPYAGGFEITGIAPGVSATNPVVVNGNGNVIEAGTPTYILALNGVSHLTINNFQFINPVPSNNKFGIMLRGACQYVTISNNIIDVGTISTSSATSGISASNSTTSATTAGNAAQYLTITNNEIIGGYYGITLMGTASYLNNYGHTVANNIVRDFYLYGIYLANADTSFVYGNDVNRATRAGLSTLYGIYLSTCRNIKIYKNKIHSSGNGSYSAYPFYITTSVNSAGYQTEIYNNAVYNIGSTSTIYGIYMLGTRDWLKINYNTLNLALPSGSSGTIRAVFYSTAPNNHEFKNNNVSISGVGSGTKHVVYSSATSTSYVSNFNNLYLGATGGTSNGIGYWTSNRVTLADWQAATLQDANSISADPGFTSANTFRTSSMAVYQLGTPILNMVDDIDGDPRHPSTPCIGADEYILYNNDAGVTVLTEPLAVCAGPALVKVRVKNYGIVALNSVTVNWSVNNVLQTAVSYSTPIAPGAEGEVTLGTINFANGVFYNMKFWTTSPNSVADQNTSNDTLLKTGFRTSLNGLYTIGAGPADDYPTIAAAVADLNDFGVCGPVVFNVAVNSGPYVGGIEITNVIGTSASNTITFNGNGNTINAAGQTYILALFGTKYITLDNFKFINPTPSADKFGISIRGEAKFVTITNCLVNVGAINTSSLSGGIVISGSTTSATTAGANGSNITITDCEIAGGYYGITAMGTASYLYCSAINISNNVIRDFYLYGIYLSNVDTAMVANNNINRATRASVSTLYGIYATTCRNVKYLKNRVHSSGNGSYSAYPFYITTSVNTPGYETELINNAVYNIPTTSSIYGLYVLGTRSYVNIYHNTVSLQLPAGSTGSIYGLYHSSAPDFHNVKNNIIAIEGDGTGSKYVVYVATTSTSYISDNNNYCINATGGSNFIGYWTANRTTLADWQLASMQDNQTSTANPVLASPAAGNVTPLNFAIDNLGTPVGVLTDLNNVNRSVTTPDVGALEFTGIGSDMSMIGGALVPGECLSTNDSLYLTVRNVIGGAVDFSVTPLTINWYVTGPVNSNGSIVLNSGTLAPVTSLTIGATGVNMSVPGVYTLNGYLSANTFNIFAGNDTLLSFASKEINNPYYVIPKNAYVGNTTATVDITARSKFFPGGGFYFSEVCQFKGAVSGWPTWLIADDYIEITGVPNSDLGGYTLEQWTTTLQSTHTFPVGTVISPGGTAVIAVGEMGSSVPSPANFYYHGQGGYTSSWSSTTASGRILKDANGSIVDAVGYYGFSFPAAANVPASEWSASNPGGSSTAGIRLTSPDNNTGSNWVVVGGAIVQDPNVLNAGCPLPVPGTLANFTWSHNGVVFANNVIDTVVGPWSTGGTYKYVATYLTPCGTLTDTVNVHVLIASVTGDTLICAGDSAMISVTLPGVGPWTLITSVGANQDTVLVTASPWVTYVSPSVTTDFTLVKIADAGNVFVNSNLTHTVSITPAPVVTLTSFATLCASDPAFTLTGGLPSGGVFSGSGVAAGMFDPMTAGPGAHQIVYTYTDPASGCSGSAAEQIVLTAGPPVTVTPDHAVCVGQSTQLEVMVGGSIQTSLIFSEYIEGSSFNKAIELFNATADTIDLANYRIAQSVNGGGWAFWHYFPAGARLAPHQTWVMVHAQVAATYFDTANANEVIPGSSVVNHNGDDARAIEVTTDGGQTWTIIDIIGDPDNDPGTGWPVAGVANATADKTLIRKPDITKGNTDWLLVAGTSTANSEYIVHPVNTFTNLGSHTYNAPPVINYTYSWSTGAVTPTITVTPSVTTTYTVTVTDPVSQCASIEHIVVTVSPAPAVNLGNDFNVCDDGFATIDAGAGFASYLWSTGASTQSINVSGATIGTNNTVAYTVTVTDANGCEGTDVVNVTAVDCSGIDDPDGSNMLTFWPNPSNGHFFVTIKGVTGDATLKVINATGQSISTEALTIQGEMIREFNLGTLAPGIYFVRLITAKDVITKPVIIK